MLSKIAAVLLTSFVLVGCANKPVIIEKPVYVGITVPDNLFDCPDDPKIPNPDTLKNNQIIQQLKDYRKVTLRCRTSNGAIKEYIIEYNKQIELKNQEIAKGG